MCPNSSWIPYAVFFFRTFFFFRYPHNANANANPKPHPPHRMPTKNLVSSSQYDSCAGVQGYWKSGPLPNPCYTLVKKCEVLHPEPSLAEGLPTSKRGHTSVSSMRSTEVCGNKELFPIILDDTFLHGLERQFFAGQNPRKSSVLKVYIISCKNREYSVCVGILGMF